MTKPINLLSLTQAKVSLSDIAFENFKNYHGLTFRSGEVDDLTSLVVYLTEEGCLISDFEDFIVGYQIPQIGKEFDLLRFGTEYIINIELKKTSDEKEIEEQLNKNSLYLKFSGLKVYHYTYVSDSKSIFKLFDSGKIQRVEITELVTLIKNQEYSREYDINEFFDPADYLVSPFNSTERFLEGGYFLTQQQNIAFCMIRDYLAICHKSGFVSLTGGAGTGKSLLAYHIAKMTLAEAKKVLIIHCGILNLGHDLLISKNWEIKPIKKYLQCIFSDYNLVIIDEAQRLSKKQFKDISNKITASQALCIFSFDKQQTFTEHENLDIESEIYRLKPVSTHSLSEKIRSNKEIADFILKLFNKYSDLEIKGGKNIFLKYFSKDDDARNYIDSLNGDEWQLIRFTPSRFKVEHHSKHFQDNIPTSHKIIGQEFDNVVIVIDELFSYHNNGLLFYNGNSYYDPRKMLFQNITRARKKLLVVIINNEELLERCISILK